jgi:uncharacterized protein YfdQ (DUF2303 family)
MADDFKSVIDVAQQAGQPHDAIGDYAIVPQGTRLEDLERFHAAPRRIKQKVVLHRVETFLKYFSAFGKPYPTGDGNSFSAVFADQTSFAVTAVFDYHGAEPAWGDHTAVYASPRSLEWTTWRVASGKLLEQAAFAQFIEDNVVDIREPTGADILEIARQFEAKSSVQFGSHLRLDNGQRQFSYSETIQGTAAKGSIKVPEQFKLGIPVFVGGVVYEVTARLRYRIADGNLRIGYELYRPEQIEQDAFNQVVQAIETETQTTVWHGSAG